MKYLVDNWSFTAVLWLLAAICDWAGLLAELLVPQNLDRYPVGRLAAQVHNATAGLHPCHANSPVFCILKISEIKV